MEQQLINALIKLIAKAGGAALMKDLIQQIDQNGNPKVWTPAEISSAVEFVNWQIENFGTADAAAMIEALEKKYNVQSADPNDASADDIIPSVPGVHGLR